MTTDQQFDDDNQLLKAAGLDNPYYSTLEAADLFFDKTDQWLYWGLREGIFVDEDGTPIKPKRVGTGSRRRYTLETIQEIALASYRRGNISKPRLAAILRRIIVAKTGGSYDQIKAVELPENIVQPDSPRVSTRAPRPEPNYYLKFEKMEPGLYTFAEDPYHYEIRKDATRDWIWRLTFTQEGSDPVQLGKKNGFLTVYRARFAADEHYKKLTGKGFEDSGDSAEIESPEIPESKSTESIEIPSSGVEYPLFTDAPEPIYRGSRP